MMIFHKERNQWGCNGYTCVEYSLISPAAAKRAFASTHCPRRALNSAQMERARGPRSSATPLAPYSAMPAIAVAFATSISIFICMR